MYYVSLLSWRSMNEMDTQCAGKACNKERGERERGLLHFFPTQFEKKNISRNYFTFCELSILDIVALADIFSARIIWTLDVLSFFNFILQHPNKLSPIGKRFRDSYLKCCQATPLLHIIVTRKKHLQPKNNNVGMFCNTFKISKSPHLVPLH